MAKNNPEFRRSIDLPQIYFAICSKSICREGISLRQVSYSPFDFSVLGNLGSFQCNPIFNRRNCSATKRTFSAFVKGVYGNFLRVRAVRLYTPLSNSLP